MLLHAFIEIQFHIQGIIIIQVINEDILHNNNIYTNC